MTEIDWDERYRGAAECRPWDNGAVDAELMRVFADFKAKPTAALEIGCGTGTNAIWLAEQGVSVVATDLAPTAIAEAKTKAETAGVNADFRVHDILQTCPVDGGTIDLVFDRGVFHVMSAEQRSTFVEHVAEGMRAGASWLCLAGSADETKPPDKGPPRMKASEIILSVEERFEVVSLNQYLFALPDGSEYRAWRALLRKRA